MAKEECLLCENYDVVDPAEQKGNDATKEYQLLIRFLEPVQWDLEGMPLQSAVHHNP